MNWSFSSKLLQRKQDLLTSGYDAYVLFTLQGLELDISEELNNNYDYCIATPLTKMSHRSRGGNKYDVQEILLGGYIFVYLRKGRDINKVKSTKNYFRILSRQNEDGKLYGKDLEYAEWVLEQEGVLSVSEAIKINGMVKIVNGPLKNLEGSIVEYSKRNRNCRIEVELFGQKIDAWLPFDWIDADMGDLKMQQR